MYHSEYFTTSWEVCRSAWSWASPCRRNWETSCLAGDEEFGRVIPSDPPFDPP